MSISCLQATILNCCLSFALYIIENSFIEFLVLENMGTAVGIVQLCCIQAEI